MHPFCDHGDSCAFLLPALSDLWATDPLGDFCASVLSQLKTSRRSLRSWRSLNVLCATLKRSMRPFGILYAFNGDLVGFCGRIREARRLLPLCKGVLVKRSMHSKWWWINMPQINYKIILHYAYIYSKIQTDFKVYNSAKDKLFDNSQINQNGVLYDNDFLLSIRYSANDEKTRNNLRIINLIRTTK